MKTLFGSALLSVALMFPSAMYAHHDSGEVKEVIVKIQTKDGVKWYKLGKDMTPVDIKPGDYVDFDYADDTIESITPATAPEETADPQSAPKKAE